MKTVERGWDEFWAEIFRIRYRRAIPAMQQYDEMVIDFCIEILDLQEGDKVFDIACGAGDHSLILAKRGMNVTAFDISNTLIEFAKQRASENGLTVNFYKGDMREVSYREQFKAALLLSHSFGFFRHEDNLRVLSGVYTALVRGGRLIIDLMNPYNLPRFQATWTKIEGGYLLSEPHKLDATEGILRGRPATFIDTEAGEIVLMNQDAMANNDIRMYTAPEITALLRSTGFSRIEMYGQNTLPKTPYTSSSERMVVVASR